MANESPFIKRYPKHVNDHEYEIHFSICNVNLSCAHGGINDVRDHVGRDKPKAAKKKKKKKKVKNQDSKFKHFHFNVMFSFSFRAIARYIL